jgi:hypothetical protein
MCTWMYPKTNDMLKLPAGLRTPMAVFVGLANGERDLLYDCMYIRLRST